MVSDIQFPYKIMYFAAGLLIGKYLFIANKLPRYF